MLLGAFLTGQRQLGVIQMLRHQSAVKATSYQNQNCLVLEKPIVHTIITEVL